MVHITVTRYCGNNIFCQPFFQYLDLSLRFNKTIPQLTTLAKRLLCCCQPRRRNSSDCSTVSAPKADTLNIRFKHFHCKTENMLLLSRYNCTFIWFCSQFDFWVTVRWIFQKLYCIIVYNTYGYVFIYHVWSGKRYCLLFNVVTFWDTV